VSNKLKTFPGQNLESETDSVLSEIERLPSVRKLVAHLGIHMKPHLEAPTKLVVATEGTIVRELSTASLGCGLGLVKTSLKKEEVTESLARKVFDYLENDVSPGQSKARRFSDWLGLTHQNSHKYYPEQDKLKNILNVESKYLPRTVLNNGPYEIGYEWRDNHFIEFQTVEKIFDQEAADKWGLGTGAVVIMYHQQGGHIPYYLGRYMSLRKKFTLRDERSMILPKILFHFSNLKIWTWPRRIWYYFFKHKFLEIPVDSREGKRLWETIVAAQNYAHTAHSTQVDRISNALSVTGLNSHLEILSQTLHTSITKENLENKEFIIHRNGVTSAGVGEPVIIAGKQNSHSYVCIGMSGVADYLFSSPHTLGQTDTDKAIKDLERAGVLKLVATLSPISSHKT